MALGAARRASRRGPLLARFKQKDGLVPLPLSYYEVLQVSKVRSSLPLVRSGREAQQTARHQCSRKLAHTKFPVPGDCSWTRSCHR